MSKRTRSVMLTALTMVTMLTLTACIKVTSHAPGVVHWTDFSIPGGKFQVLIEFDGQVDPASIVANSNVLLSSDGVPVAVTAEPGAAGNSVLITSVDDYGTFCSFEPNCYIELQLLGNGLAPITDAGGYAFDGDADGNAGGDFRTRFGILG